MSLIEHLSELRIRLFVCFGAIALCFLVSFLFADPVLHFLVKPVLDLSHGTGKFEELTFDVAPDGLLRLRNASHLDLENLATRHFRLIFSDSDSSATREVVFGQEPVGRIYYHSPLDPFMMQMKVALLLGILMSLPVILWQAWIFTKPGLTPKERRLVGPMLSAAIVLFPIGAMFAYYLIRLVLALMQNYRVEGIDPLLSFYPYLSLLTTMMLAFGAVFELPLVIAIAARIGLVTPYQLTKFRRHAYVVLAVAAMVVTPADGFTMIATFFPLLVLYEVSVLLSRPMAALRTREAGTGGGRLFDNWSSEDEE